MAGIYRKLTWQIVEESAVETVNAGVMVFAIHIGATAFSMVFLYSGVDRIVEEIMVGLPGQKWTFLFLVMLIIFIVVPINKPVVEGIGLDPLWFAILIAMNLQTSFLTPPFTLHVEGGNKNLPAGRPRVFFAI